VNSFASHPWLRVISAAALAASVGACSKTDNAKPVASASFSASKPRVPLGSPVILNYRFDVAPDAAISGDYKVFVHVSDSDGKVMWNDDHDPPTPTSKWKPGQTIQYSRTKFIPVFPYLGEATVRVGLYKGNERLPLSGIDPADRTSTSREYKVGTLELVPQSENIFIQYRGGWHPDEFSPENPSVSWHWTQKLASFSFPNPKKDVTLYFEYDARPDAFNGQPQIVTLYLGEQVLATFPADTTTPVLRLIPITAAQFGASEMADVRIEVDKTFVPARLPNGGKDPRELVIRVYHTFVEVK
jgi:hypothetical protein